MRTSKEPAATEHFRLVLGHDPDKDEVIYHEPAEANGAYRRMPRAQLLDLWPLKYEAEKWLAIRLRLEPGRIAGISARGERTAADYAQHVHALKRRLPGPRFSIVLAPPFVVVGDEDRRRVAERAHSTVEWAVEKLKTQYFSKDPGEIIDIWLFRDKESYERNALKLFGSHPTTPFGYYSSEHRALVMNIATGGGTLVHEIVHPFMSSNFPACPAWFNEGLASLYEQSGEREGRIVGHTNWRLAGLQKAIESGSLPSFRKLLGTTEHEFYREDSGTNYAQARYLCYYLQEKGLLEAYYKAFVKSSKDDPTGYTALLGVLKRKAAEMPAFEAEWKGFVRGLRFE